MSAITNPVMTPNMFLFQLGQACPHLGTWPSWISSETGNFGYRFVGTEGLRSESIFRTDGMPLMFREIYRYALKPVSVSDEVKAQTVQELGTRFLAEMGQLDSYIHKPLKGLVPDLYARFDRDLSSGRLNSNQMKDMFGMEGTTVVDAIIKIHDDTDSLRPAVSWFAGAALSYGQETEIFRTGGDDLQTAASIIGAVVLFNALGSGDKSANAEALDKAVRVLNSNNFYASSALALRLKANQYADADTEAAGSAHKEAAETWLESVDFYWSERPARVISLRYGLEEALQSGDLDLIDNFYHKAADHHTQEGNDNLAAEDLLRAVQAHLERTVAPGRGASVKDETNWFAVESRLLHAHRRLEASNVSHPNIDPSTIKRLRYIAEQMATGERGK